MSDNAKLIAEAREGTSYIERASRDLYGDKATLGSRLVDALEAAEQRIEFLEEQDAGVREDIGNLEHERDAHVAVIATIRHNWRTQKPELFHGVTKRILDDADTDAALRERDAEKWDEGLEAGATWPQSTPRGIPVDPPLNPYREGNR